MKSFIHKKHENEILSFAIYAIKLDIEGKRQIELSSLNHNRIYIGDVLNAVTIYKDFLTTNRH